MKRSIRLFKDLALKYDQIKEINTTIYDIYVDFVNISSELELAEERLTKLQDPNVLAKILESVNRLNKSSFIKD